MATPMSEMDSSRSRFLSTLSWFFLSSTLILLGCSEATPPPKTPGDTISRGASGKPPSAAKTPSLATDEGKLRILSLAPAHALPKDMIRGKISFIEKSGAGLYLEIKVGKRTVGVELASAVAKAHHKQLQKGTSIAIRGKRGKGEKDIAFVVEVAKPMDLHLVPIAKGRSRLVPPRLTAPFRPGARVEMIAAIGTWPPMTKHAVAKKVARVARDGATLLVADSGLTELWKAYQAPNPYYEVIRHVADQAKGRHLQAAFYFPSFELRREGRSRRSPSLLQKAPTWAQVTLSGKPLLKKHFAKEEFWNKAGDEALWVSPLSPWRKVFIKHIQEAVRRGASRVFIDVPYFQSGKTFITGASPYAAKAFKEATGLALPKARKAGDPTYHRWIWWRHDVIRGFFRDLRQAIRAINPAAKLIVEEYPSSVDGATTTTGVDIGLTGDEVDLFAHEYSLKQFDKKPFSFADRVAIFSTLSLYRGLDGSKPTWVLSYAHDVRGSRTNAALHLALDASFWETKAPEMNDTTVSRPWRQKLFSWFSKHRDAFGGSSPLASVAILYSPRARDFCPGHFRTLRKVSKMLTQRGLTYHIVSTRDLSTHDQAALSDHEVILLPSVCALAPEEARQLRRVGVKVPLVAVGARPSRGAWGIRNVDHHLPIPEVSLEETFTALQRRWVKVNADHEVAVAMLRHGTHEVQLRLVSLRSRETRATVSIRLPVKRATLLPYLKKERSLALTHHDGVTSFSVTIPEFTLIRLRF